MKYFRSDLKKYKSYSDDKSVFVLMITTQGLWALFFYRMSNSIYKSNSPNFFKKPILLLFVFLQKCIEVCTGISIPYSAQIGDSFYIGHFGNIIINGQTVIGNNCNISQGVTIGVSGRKENRGVPIIGDNVYIGANAVIAGRITIGDNCVIGANSLVVNNVESNKTVLGVPAKVVSNNTSIDYI